MVRGYPQRRLRLKRQLRLFVLSGALVAIPAAFVHPFGALKAQRSDRPLLLDASFDPQVVRILERSCQDCHSERTAWPLYSYVPPLSWMIERDVARGRGHMNLSRWNGYPPERQQEILSEMSNLVRNRVMPLPRYLMLHPEARLSDAEVDYLYQWAKSERRRLKTDTAAAHAAILHGSK
jgi:cytochrome c